MKKNKMMRTASVLLVAALMTTSMISGTFAKYTTSEYGTDTAQVAKFGVKITANGSTFAKTYTKDDTKVDSTITNSVVAAGTTDNQKNVVAPGTSGEMAKMTLTGTPEVAVKVSYKGDFDVSNWTVDTSTFYCPLNIIIKSNGTTENSNATSTTIKGLAYTSETEFEQAVNNAIAAYSKEYAPGTDLSKDIVKGDSLTVSWEWPFEAETKDSSTKQTDENDTKLGDAETAGTVTLKVTTTVTQID